MSIKGRIRPSALSSAITLIVCVVMLCLASVSTPGPSKIFTILVWLAVAGYHAFNLFSERGAANEVVDFDVSTQIESRSPPSESVGQRIIRLNDLKTAGLVSDKEYEEQKSRILREI